MKIVAMKKMADGNESVGTMWTETKVFEETATLKEVLMWGGNLGKRDIVITKADE